MEKKTVLDKKTVEGVEKTAETMEAFIRTFWEQD